MPALCGSRRKPNRSSSGTSSVKSSPSTGGNPPTANDLQAQASIEDLYITADAEAFVKWHAGRLTWAQATREGRIQADGLPSLVRAFPTWNARSMFAHIRPVSR